MPWGGNDGRDDLSTCARTASACAAASCAHTSATSALSARLDLRGFSGSAPLPRAAASSAASSSAASSAAAWARESEGEVTQSVSCWWMGRRRGAG